MRQTILVQPTMTHPALQGKPEFTFASRPFVQSGLFPKYYAVYRKANGSVVRFDYSSQQEYQEHRNRIVAKLTEAHKANPVLGCDCESCKHMAVPSDY